MWGDVSVSIFILGLVFRFAVTLTTQEDQEKFTVLLEPEHDSFLPSGSELNITCRLSPCRDTAPTGLHLVRLGHRLTRGTQHMKGPCAVTLIIKDVTKDDTGTFDCRYDGWRGGMSPRPTIYVGDPPKAEPFKCVSDNFRSANCSWCSQTKLGWQHETTDLQFKFGDFRKCPSFCHRIGGVTKSCAKFIDDCSCHICGYDRFSADGFEECKSDARRKQFVKYGDYTFYLTIKNKFGITRRSVQMQMNMTQVKPDRVSSIKVRNISATTAEIVWGPPEELPPYYGDLNYWLHFTSKHGNKTVLVGRQVFRYNLQGLMPYTEYTISVWSKPVAGGYFSDHSHTTMTTLEAAPGACPVVSPGGYLSAVPERDKRNRTVYLYYETLPEKFRNGVLLGYKIAYSPQSGEGPPLHTTTVFTADRSSTSVRLELQTEVEYTVTVSAYNGVGESQGCGPITIPPHKEYENVDVMEAEDNGTHVTFWWDSPPKKDLQSLVLVECNVPSKSTIVCQQGSTKFITIPGNRTSYAHKKLDTRDIVYNRAAIYTGGSSGLEPYWICIWPFNAKVVKPKFDLKPIRPGNKAAELIEVMIQPATCDDHTGRVIYYNLTWTLLPRNENTQARHEIISGRKRTHTIPKPGKGDRYEVALQAVGHLGPSGWTTMGYPQPQQPGNVSYLIIPLMIAMTVLLFMFFIGRWIYRRYGNRLWSKCKAEQPILPPRPLPSPPGRGSIVYESLLDVQSDASTSYPTSSSSENHQQDQDLGASSSTFVSDSGEGTEQDPPQHPARERSAQLQRGSTDSDGYSPTQRLDSMDSPPSQRVHFTGMSMYLHPLPEGQQEVSESGSSSYYSPCTEYGEGPVHVNHEDIQGAAWMPMSDLGRRHGVSVDFSLIKTPKEEADSFSITDSDYGYK